MRRMPVGIVTGASRGLGLALARALNERGWELVVDARGADALAESTARPRRRHRAWPATSPIPSTGARWSRRPATAIDLLVNNASLLGPSPHARAAPTTRSTRCARSTRSNVRRAARAASSSRCRMLARGRGRLDITSDAAVEAVRGLGRLRRRRRPRSSSSAAILAAEQPGPARLRGRPGRHAHPDAPGRLPGRGHLRPPAARGERARRCCACRGRPAERSLPGRASSAGRAVTRMATDVALAGTSRRDRGAGRPRRRALLVPRRATARSITRRFDELPRPPEPGDLAGGEHVGDPARGVAGRSAARTRCAPSLDRRSGRR